MSNKENEPENTEIRLNSIDIQYKRNTMEGRVLLHTPQKDIRRYTTDSLNYKSQILEISDCYSDIQFSPAVAKDSSFVKNECNDGDQSSLIVAVRVRPFSQRELNQADVRCNVSMINKQTTVKTDSGNVYSYTFDFSFWSFDKEAGEFTNQEQVYKSLAQPLLTKAFQGYNTSLFAYGQTGSGKSYSIMGHADEEGIVPRFSRELFEKTKEAERNMVKTSLEISFFEIYNEKIHDLLASKKDKGSKKTPLKVREHPVLGPYIEGLSTHLVNSFEDIQSWIALGNKNRATAATGMNDKSSRSHSIFTMVLIQTKVQDIDGQKHDHSTTSKINLIDLAGSERQSTSQCSGERLREGININKSLMTLGKVISVLSEISSNGSKKKKLFIPYRDSVLTWLLKESLGGNSRTAMIATISPANSHCEETLSTLRYAQQARCIVNRVRINEDTKTKKIQELLAEIKRLRNITSLGDMNPDFATGLAEVAALRLELENKEKELQEMKRTWEEKLFESEEIKKKQFHTLQRSGIALKMDQMLPHFVNLSEDPQLSEVLLYLIKEGQTCIGRSTPASVCDIQLTGALISDNHCIIINTDETVTITPIGTAPTYVNGSLLSEITKLYHGDRVILGGDHYFRFVHPKEAVNIKVTSDGVQGEVKDFDFAYKELMKVQELRLADQLECAKKQVHDDLFQQIDEEKHKADELLEKQKTGYEDQLTTLNNILKKRNNDMKKSELQKEELLDEMKRQKQELDFKILEEKQRQMKMFEEAEKMSNTPECDGLLLEALKKTKDCAEKNLQRLALHQQESQNSSLISSSNFNSENSYSPSNTYKQTMLLINSLTTVVDDVHGQSKLCVEDIKGKQQFLDSISKPDTVLSTESKRKIPSSTVGLYHIYLTIYEANAICWHLKKNIIFSRDDSFDERKKLRTLIKCSQTDLKICTYWSLEVFQNKLRLLRDIYETGDNNTEEIFADENNWERDADWLEFTSCSSPEIHGLPVILTSPVKTLTNIRRRSSPGLSAHKSKSVFDPTVSNCHYTLASVLASVMEFPQKDISPRPDSGCIKWSCADYSLECCKNIILSVNTVSKQWTTSPDDLSEDSLEGKLIEIMQNSYTLSSNYKTWLISQDRSRVQQLFNPVISAVKKVNSEVAQFFRACSSQLDHIIQETGLRILCSIENIIQLTGGIALATNESMAFFTDVNNLQVENIDIYRVFLKGCDLYIDKTLQAALRSLEEWEVLSQSYTESNSSVMLGIPKNIEILVSAVKLFLEKSQEILVHLCHSSHETRYDSLSVQLYNQCRANVSNIKKLVESVASLLLLLKSSTDQDLSKRFSGILTTCGVIDSLAEQLSSLAKQSENKRIFVGPTTINDSESGVSDMSSLQETPLEQLEYAGQEVKAIVKKLKSAAATKL